jgi:hypothetical protein
MSITAVVALKIADFGICEVAFNSRENVRVAAGIDVKGYRDIDNANRVGAIGIVPSKEALFRFMPSPEQQEAMKITEV